MTTLYKVTGPNGEPLHGGSGAWPLPTDTEPGAWRTVDGAVQACRNGLHLSDAHQLRYWLKPGAIVWRAETRNGATDVGDKYVTDAARLLPGPIDAESVMYVLDRPSYIALRSTASRRVGSPARSARDRFALDHMHSLPADHPLRARAERERARQDRARKRDQREETRLADRARPRVAAFLGEDIRLVVSDDAT